MKRTLLLLLFFPLPALADAFPPPPVPVECRSDTSCDRNPAHLAAFVAGFYRWYVGRLVAFDGISNKDIPDFAHEEQRVMNKSITAAYRAWNDHQLSLPPLDRSSQPEHCPGGTDFILCLQDWSNDWMRSATAQAQQINRNTASVKVTLPAANWFHYTGGPLKRLVRLKVENHVWKIDGVTALP